MLALRLLRACPAAAIGATRVVRAAHRGDGCCRLRCHPAHLLRQRCSGRRVLLLLPLLLLPLHHLLLLLRLLLLLLYCLLAIRPLLLISRMV